MPPSHHHKDSECVVNTCIKENSPSRVACNIKKSVKVAHWLWLCGNRSIYLHYCRKVVHNIELYYTAERWYTISNYIILQKGGTQYWTILYCRKVVHNIELYYTAERWYTISNYIILQKGGTQYRTILLYTAERWYTVETRSPITHAVRMLIRITRMIRTSSEPTFRVSRAASTWKFNTMTLKEWAKAPGQHVCTVAIIFQ